MTTTSPSETPTPPPPPPDPPTLPAGTEVQLKGLQKRVHTAEERAEICQRRLQTLGEELSAANQANARLKAELAYARAERDEAIAVKDRVARQAELNLLTPTTLRKEYDELEGNHRKLKSQYDEATLMLRAAEGLTNELEKKSLELEQVRKQLEAASGKPVTSVPVAIKRILDENREASDDIDNRAAAHAYVQKRYVAMLALLDAADEDDFRQKLEVLKLSANEQGKKTIEALAQVNRDLAARLSNLDDQTVEINQLHIENELLEERLETRTQSILIDGLRKFLDGALPSMPKYAEAPVAAFTEHADQLISHFQSLQALANTYQLQAEMSEEEVRNLKEQVRVLSAIRDEAAGTYEKLRTKHFTLGQSLVSLAVSVIGKGATQKIIDTVTKEE